jgi:hypothetical protein
MPQIEKSFQLNLNTILLGLCVSGIAWTLKSINDLDSRMAVQEVIVNADHEAIKDMNRVQEFRSRAYQDLMDRMLKLETLESSKH